MLGCHSSTPQWLVEGKDLYPRNTCGCVGWPSWFSWRSHASVLSLYSWLSVLAVCSFVSLFSLGASISFASLFSLNSFFSVLGINSVSRINAVVLGVSAAIDISFMSKGNMDLLLALRHSA